MLVANLAGSQGCRAEEQREPQLRLPRTCRSGTCQLLHTPAAPVPPGQGASYGAPATLHSSHVVQFSEPHDLWAHAGPTQAPWTQHAGPAAAPTALSQSDTAEPCVASRDHADPRT